MACGVGRDEAGGVDGLALRLDGPEPCGLRILVEEEGGRSLAGGQGGGLEGAGRCLDGWGFGSSIGALAGFEGREEERKREGGVREMPGGGEERA